MLDRGAFMAPDAGKMIRVGVAMDVLRLPYDPEDDPDLVPLRQRAVEIVAEVLKEPGTD